MTANIYSHEVLIGTADLVVGDESMGCVYGKFDPTIEYFTNAQKSIWKFTANRDVNSLIALRLNVQLCNGYFPYPIGGITIDDLEELPNEPLRIDIAGLFRHVIEDFFHSNPPRPFLEEPWHPITIQQKIAFEDELLNEITVPNQHLLNKLIGNIKFEHSLHNMTCSALGKSKSCDDILFSIHSPKTAELFAVVHLTWKGKLERNGWPKTLLFKSFDDFKHDKMYPDKIEWEY